MILENGPMGPGARACARGPTGQGPMISWAQGSWRLSCVLWCGMVCGVVVLCDVVLCCVVLCSVVLCWGVSYRVLYCAAPCHAVPCRAVTCYVMLRRVWMR